MQTTVKDILSTNHLQRTPCRVSVLEVLKEAGIALSEPEIKNLLAYAYDRATLFRTLRTFVENNIIHEVIVNKNEIKYALTHVNRTDEYQQGHAHFNCISCGRVFCLGAVSRNLLNIPEGFEISSFEVLFNGKCIQCRKN